jgi:hypothetical protein
MKTTDEQACDEECSRRGYDDGVCHVTSYVPSQNNNWCPGDNYIDIVGKIGKCKSGSYYGMYLKLDCLCCHDCPDTAPTITRTIGDKCTLTLTPHAWDDDDGDIHGYSDFSQSGTGAGFGIHSIEVSMDDNKEKKFLGVLPMEDCKANLKFKNSWWIYEVDSLIVRTEISEKDAGNKLSAGFDISVSGDGCTFSGNSPCPTSDNQKMVTDSGSAIKTYNIEYCGDGECSCGEKKNTCAEDCGTCAGSCNDPKNLGQGSISLGGYESSWTCGTMSGGDQDWLKIKAKSKGKLKITLTPPQSSNYDLVVYGDCGNELGSSLKA